MRSRLWAKTIIFILVMKWVLINTWIVHIRVLIYWNLIKISTPIENTSPTRVVINN